MPGWQMACRSRRSELAGLPLVGENLAALWTQLAAAGSSGLLAKVTPYAAETGKWVLAQAGGLGGMLCRCC